jgi:1,2-diacylglycerol 3-beta-glucosyltransferase
MRPSRVGNVPLPAGQTRFVVLIPAHDEEDGLAATLRSLDEIRYPAACKRVVVVADRCRDRTADVARSLGADCFERSDGAPGKGAAIAWAIEKLRSGSAPFDALVIVDADTVVDARLLAAFDEGLRAGHEVQQGYNYLSNPWETPFTRIIAVTSVLRNGFFYAGKEHLGLPAMLTGTGMCFSRRILDRYPWSAFSVGEDWEFSASLLLNGEEVHFNREARVLAKESRGFRQASSQRLRWASGRHAVASASAADLFLAGLRTRRPALCDAALTIVAPTYSAQATIAIVCFVLACLVSRQPGFNSLAATAFAPVALLAAYFLAGAAMTESPARALGGIALIPAFLPWRVTIEIMGLLGCGRTRWVRTSRAAASR